MQQRDPGHAFHAAKCKVEGADHRSDKSRLGQVDLEYGGDRRRAADVVTDVHQQQRIDHDQRNNIFGRTAIFLGDSTGNSDLSGVVDAFDQYQAKQREANCRANHRP